MRESIFKIYIFFLFFLFISCTVCAQISKIDSLKKLLPTQRDTVYLKMLTEICWNYRNVHSDSAEKYATQAVALAQQLNHPYLLTLSTQYLGVIAQSQGNYLRGMEYYYKTIELAEKYNFQERLAYAYQSLGRANNEQGNRSLAVSYLKRSLVIFEKLQNQEGITYCYLTLGKIYTDQKQFGIGLENYEKALSIRLQMKNMNGVAAVYSALGEHYQLRNNYTKAIDYLEKARKIFAEFNNTRGMIAVLNRLSKIYIHQKELEKALFYAMESIKLARQASILEDLKHSYQNISDIYTAKQDYLNAYKYQVLLNQYKDSIFNYEKEKKAQEIEMKYMEQKREQEIESLKKENKNQRSLTYLSSVIAVLMVLVGIAFFFNIRQKQKANQLLRLQQKEIQEKNDVLAQLNAEITVQNGEIKQQKEEQEKLNIFKDKLFSIISHDLRNPLASLKGALFLFKSEMLTTEERADLVEKLARDLQSSSDLLDNLLNWTKTQMQGLRIMPDALNLSRLIEENFNLLKPQAEKKQIQLICNIPADITVLADLEMVKTVIRNLLHNAIKYTPSLGTVRVNTFLTDDYVITAIQDSGKGMSREEQNKLFSNDHFSKHGTENEKGSGLGLLLAKDFVEKNAGSIWVESVVNEGSTFSFTLPIFKG
jgi:signal transduction histidine kinase